MSYDAKCYDLAEAFIDEATWAHERHRHELAQRIQETIEEYCDEQEDGMHNGPAFIVERKKA